MKLHIVIYNSNCNFGGAEVSFLNLISALIVCDGISVTVVAPFDSKFSRIALDKSVEVKELGKWNPQRVDDATYIFNGQTLRSFIKAYGFVPEKTRLWFMHPDEPAAFVAVGYYRIKHALGWRLAELYLWLFKLLPINRFKVLKDLIKHDRVFVMDGAVRQGLNFVIGLSDGEARNIRYLPVVTGLTRSLPLKQRPAELTSFVYFGRVEDFKTKPLLRLVEDLSKINGSMLHIVGDGRDLPLVEKKAQECGLRTVSYGFLDQDKALALINSVAHVAFAMGISALVCAQAKVPVVVINAKTEYSDRPIYNFIFEETDYGVGDIIDGRLRPNKEMVLKPMDKILDSCKKHWLEYAESSFQKSKQHDFDNFKLLVKALIC